MVEVIRKSRRRQLTLQVRPNGDVRILGNAGLRLKDVEVLLSDKIEWIKQCRQKFLSQIDDSDVVGKISFTNGDKLFFLGEEKAIVKVPTPLKRVFFSVTEKNFCLHLPESRIPLTDDQLFDRFKAFLKQRSQQEITPRVLYWAEQMGLQPEKISYRFLSSRWGSCSSRGKISLNSKLIMASPEVIDSVIVHELAHLKHMNHSKKFWDLVYRHFPDYDESDRWLKKHQRALDVSIS